MFDERSIAKLNCLATLQANADRVVHFRARIDALARTATDTLIVVLNVDEPSGFGGRLAELLMPGYDWQQYRDLGQIPFARGLAGWVGVHEFLEEFDREAADKLWGLGIANEVAVLVIDHGVAEVFPASVATP